MFCQVKCIGGGGGGGGWDHGLSQLSVEIFVFKICQN